MFNPRKRRWQDEDWGDDPDHLLFLKIRAMVAQYYPAANNLPETAWAAQALAEAVNSLAKSENESFYNWKGKAIALALNMGAKGGWSSDGTFNLYTPEAGVSSFHDPYGDVLNSLPTEFARRRWPFAWSGVRRQGEAETIIEDPKYRRVIRDKTTPDPLNVFIYEGEHPSRVRKEQSISPTRLNSRCRRRPK